MSVLSVPDIRPEVHDSQQECLYHHIICYHRAVPLLDRQQKETDWTEYHCRVSCGRRSCAFVTAGRSLNQLRRFSDADLRSDVRGPHGVNR